MYQRNYAYGIMVNGTKRIGGTIHANSMEDAVRGIMTRVGLTIERKESVYRPFDGALIPQAEWLLNEEKANIYVWAPPEYFNEN
jgi:hypothetical protein